MDIKHLILELPKSDRKNFVKTQLVKYKIKPEIIEAIYGKDLRESGSFSSIPYSYTLDSEERGWNNFACHLSWIKALQYAKRQKYDYFAIYEDDCLLEESYTEKLQTVINELPEKWVFVNLGPRESSRIELIQGKNYLSKVTGTATGTQSVLFNGKEVDRVLYQLLDWKNWVQIMSPMITFPKFCCYPALTTQSDQLKTNIRI